jgi:hypothetical protein
LRSEVAVLARHAHRRDRAYHGRFVRLELDIDKTHLRERIPKNVTRGWTLELHFDEIDPRLKNELLATRH